MSDLFSLASVAVQPPRLPPATPKRKAARPLVVTGTEEGQPAPPFSARDSIADASHKPAVTNPVPTQPDRAAVPVTPSQHAAPQKHIKPQQGSTERSANGKRHFCMHENLLHSVITRQAGTLGKAVLEAVMNACDAQATLIEVTTTRDTVTITDNGHGFKSMEEIDMFFDTFGIPHAEGDCKHGTFRMGRGQLFAFGRNVWQTNEYQMTVDIKKHGLDYDFQVLAEPSPGCSIAITLYDRLQHAELDAINLDIAKWTTYTGVTTTLNGKLVTRDPATEKWTHVTDEAYFRLRGNGTLETYNQGVFVKEHGSYRYGTGGVVVSRKKMKVNFARNDIQSDCRVWKKIEITLRDVAGKKVDKKPRLTDGERDYLAKTIRDCTEPFHQTLTYAVITDVEGRHQPLRKLIMSTQILSLAGKGDTLAAKVQTSTPGTLVMAPETLGRFSVETPKELVALLQSIIDRQANGIEKSYYAGFESIVIKPIDELTDGLSNSYEIVPEKDLTKHQATSLQALSLGMRIIPETINAMLGQMNQPVTRRRKLLAGKSNSAQAWTNGTSYIAVDLSMLRLTLQGAHGCARLAGLLLHEYLHREASTGTHSHDAEFYETYHDLAINTDVIGKVALAVMNGFNRYTRLAGGKPNRAGADLETEESRSTGNVGYDVALDDDVDEGDGEQARAA